jgi:hypothetical protein
MEATQTSYPQDTNPLSFESVWAALKETDRIVKANAHQIGKLSDHVLMTDTPA